MATLLINPESTDEMAELKITFRSSNSQFILLQYALMASIIRHKCNADL